MTTDPKTKAVLNRIAILEEDIAMAHEYLASGTHVHSHKFRALFNAKTKNNEALPPHVDWVSKVFLPRRERALREAEKLLDRLR